MVFLYEFIGKNVPLQDRLDWLERNECVTLGNHVIKKEVVRTLGQTEAMRQVEKSAAENLKRKMEEQHG